MKLCRWREGEDCSIPLRFFDGDEPNPSGVVTCLVGDDGGKRRSWERESSSMESSIIVCVCFQNGRCDGVCRLSR